MNLRWAAIFSHFVIFLPIDPILEFVTVYDAKENLSHPEQPRSSIELVQEASNQDHYSVLPTNCGFVCPPMYMCALRILKGRGCEQTHSTLRSSKGDGGNTGRE